MLANEEILAEARQILGTQEIEITKKGWAVFWCPAHPDEAQAGTTGAPNFGIDLHTGRFNCFRCGFKGGSLTSLAKALRVDYVPKNREYIPRKSKREFTDGYSVRDAFEAVADAQARLLKSPAMSYLKHRGVTPYTAMVYGLGYAVGAPYVSRETAQAGWKLGMIYRGEWLWAESVIYADPVADPKVINVCYLPPEYIKQPRAFQLGKHPHRTWGERLAPLGAWRMTERTRAVLIVEGLFDMLIGAQFLEQHRLYPEVVCVYTNGASPSSEIIDWFGDHDLEYFLVRDMDKAGADWTSMITKVLKENNRTYTLLFPPDDMDPDEAFLSGWWPPCIS
jgi:DNA primase